MNGRTAKSAQVPDPAEIVEPGEGAVSRVGVYRGDGSRLAVFVGKKRVAVIPIADAGIVAEGDPWSAELAERLFDAARTLAATRHALRILASRAKPKSALRRQLVLRGHEARAVDRAIERIEAAGLIDDRAFALHTAERLAERGGQARRLIENKLRQKGIDASLARDAVREAATELDEADEAIRLAQARAPRMDPRLEPEAKARRLFAWLARRGFDSGDARRAVELALRTDETA